MRALIIPDLHNHVENAEHWLGVSAAPRVIFLGDYFDDFHDDAFDARRTATWLRHRIETTEDVFLIGNHDAAYMFAEAGGLYCPGFTPEKAEAIRGILERRHWDRFKLVHQEQEWLLSHAGIHPAWIGETGVAGILRRCAEAVELAWEGEFDPILGAGLDRGGKQRHGGPLWMDWGSLVPVPGINQIVGHTPGREARMKIGPESENHCLDVHNGAVAAVLEKGRVAVLASCKRDSRSPSDQTRGAGNRPGG